MGQNFSGVILLAAAVVISCGEADSLEQELVVDCASQGPIDSTALLDDFEDTDIALPNIQERSGDWWISSDESPSGTISPPPGGATPERLDRARCNSLYGLHVVGRGFEDWGAVVSVSLRWDGDAGRSLPVDLSRYRGVRFWARVAKRHAAEIRLSLHDSSAHPDGGICDATSTVPGIGCWDGFGTIIGPLGTQWSEFKIPFDGLTQRGFGVPAEALDTENVFIAEWAIGPDASFDFWLDDISFYE